MRILSARVLRARRLRDLGRVEAMVMLLVKPGDRAAPYEARVLTSAPARAPGAAPLRERLLASAKLLHAIQAQDGPLRGRRAA
ncbi:hypothetical protein [Frigidibacter mobilis]|uniref:Uncharacterized protein n=1 Tax=Frigidibacter mobilis TaxID=1335048 RepID=A0A159Z7E3_9RHOB|nr:hypothetical protein [Frigidibacter mobilis]AMY71352.1 hypothetical protein AKL17_4136 [Frigidibacter mobilis]